MEKAASQLPDLDSVGLTQLLHACSRSDDLPMVDVQDRLFDRQKHDADVPL